MVFMIIIIVVLPFNIIISKNFGTKQLTNNERV